MSLHAELRRNRWSVQTARKRGCLYMGPHDFILREGEDMHARPLPAHIRAGQVGMCFGNAIATGALYRLAYVEGYLWHQRITDRNAAGERKVDLFAGSPRPVALHHAWNLDADGNVVDVTIPDEIIPPEEREYCGVRFSLRHAHRATWDNDASILVDPKHGWPLLRAPWRGEESPGDIIGLLAELRAALKTSYA